MLREFFHNHLRGSSTLQRILRPPRTLPAHGNDQRSLASVGAYGTGSPSSKSVRTGHVRPASPRSRNISRKSKVWAAGGGVTWAFAP